MPRSVPAVPLERSDGSATAAQVGCLVLREMCTIRFHRAAYERSQAPQNPSLAKAWPRRFSSSPLATLTISTRLAGQRQTRSSGSAASVPRMDRRGDGRDRPGGTRRHHHQLQRRR